MGNPRSTTEDQANRRSEPLFCGVDVGASSTKLVLLDGRREVLGSAIKRSGVDYAATARICLAEAVENSGVGANQVLRTVSTGYGRRNVDFADDTLTELSCHGVGCYHYFPWAITIVDIGCQDNKIIRLDEDGRRVDFKMNRKCAAGTGAFLEEIALRLDIELDELEGLANSTDEAVPLNSFCTVFASTEILAHLRRGEPLADLIRGAFASVVSRVTEMDRLDGEVVLTGGVVAHNPTIAQIFDEALGGAVRVPTDPQFTGALGAALTALAQADMPKEVQHA
jgi:predicted CoA-substrate-specific enzyme activase